jgi:hypothetical protein
MAQRVDQRQASARFKPAAVDAAIQRALAEFRVDQGAVDPDHPVEISRAEDQTSHRANPSGEWGL